MSHASHRWQNAGRLPISGLLLAVLLVCLHAAASAQTAAPTPTPLVTYLTMSGDENDYIGGPNDYLYKPSDTTFAVGGSDGTGDGIVDAVSVSVVQGNYDKWWYLDFRTDSMGKNLTPGFYPNAQRFGEPGHPMLDISGNGAGCNQTEGSFNVHEIKVDYSGSEPKITNFTVSFVQKCDFGPGVLIGTLFYRYTGSQPVYNITGQMLDTNGNPVGGVKVRIKGSRIGQTTTDAAGNYSFVKLLSGGNYRVEPTPPTGYAFKPTSRNFYRLLENKVGNFTAIPSYKISGRVLDAAGNPIAGAAVSLNGLSPALVYTDSTGRYSFPNLRADGNYTVYVTKQHYSFTPHSRVFYGLPSDQEVNFTGNLVKYSLSGKVLDVNGMPMAGVTVNLGGSSTATVKTDANGAYGFKYLQAGGNYHITPSKTFYRFTPPAHFFFNLSGSWASANFTGHIATYSISGTVLDSNANPLEGVTVTLGGAQSGSAVTNASGYYVITGVSAGGDYTVAPSLEGRTFNPASRSYAALNGDKSDANFISSP